MLNDIISHLYTNSYMNYFGVKNTQISLDVFWGMVVMGGLYGSHVYTRELMNIYIMIATVICLNGSLPYH